MKNFETFFFCCVDREGLDTNMHFYSLDEVNEFKDDVEILQPLLDVTNEITKSNTKFCSDIYKLFKNV